MSSECGAAVSTSSELHACRHLFENNHEAVKSGTIDWQSAHLSILATAFQFPSSIIWHLVQMLLFRM